MQSTATLAETSVLMLSFCGAPLASRGGRKDGRSTEKMKLKTTRTLPPANGRWFLSARRGVSGVVIHFSTIKRLRSTSIELSNYELRSLASYRQDTPKRVGAHHFTLRLLFHFISPPSFARSYRRGSSSSIVEVVFAPPSCVCQYVGNAVRYVHCT